MSTVGLRTAKPPLSPYTNLTATARTGTTKCGSAIWQVECTCGASWCIETRFIKKGTARCDTCNPSTGAGMANAILAALPAAYEKIERKTKLTAGQVRYRIDWMRARDMCHIGDWDRADQQGSFGPIFHAGKGDDVPCSLKPRTRLDNERRYRRRVKNAIQKAEAGGKEDGRYMRQIALRKASETARRTRNTPQTWLSALMPVTSAGKSRLQPTMPAEQ